jgi:O-antigen ligase
VKSNRAPDAASAASRAAAAAVWLEAGLAGSVFVLSPVLVLVSRGAAPLGAVAGLFAAGLVMVRHGPRLAPLRPAAAILAALLLWGGLSALWSIDPLRSLLLDARLAALFAAGLALAAASGRLAAPRRMALAVFYGTAFAIVLGFADLASRGGLSHFASIRPFYAYRLNQQAVWVALIVLPAVARLMADRRRAAALAAAAVLAATVLTLADTTAKLALAVSLPAAGLCYWRRRAVTRIAAALSVLAIITVPLTLPHLARLPRVFAAVDALKVSAGHRLLIWSFVGDRIAERPFLGWGLDSARAIPGGSDQIRAGENWLPLHPHNGPLQTWLELGAPGAALFALLAAWLWLQLGSVAWPDGYAAAAAGSLTIGLLAASSGWGLWQEWWIATLELALFAILTLAPPAVTPPPRRGWRGAGRSGRAGAS